jgi:hypothetical protein
MTSAEVTQIVVALIGGGVSISVALITQSKVKSAGTTATDQSVPPHARGDDIVASGRQWQSYLFWMLAGILLSYAAYLMIIY